MSYCRCVLIWDTPDVNGHCHQHCHQEVHDGPFCENCEDRHPGAFQVGVIRVTQLPLTAQHPGELGVGPDQRRVMPV
jgi:hypothetical protein